MRSALLKPTPLKPGARIGITCPAGAVNPEGMEYMYDQIRVWGFEPVPGKTVGTNYFKFSGTDADRLNDLQMMLDDSSLDAILFGRGGYGVVRIIDLLDFTQFKVRPKWLVGYSDITCIHAHLQQVLQIQSIHAHMYGGYQPDSSDETSTQSIYHLLQGGEMHYQTASHPMNQNGRGEGVLIGGNLALLSDIAGSVSDPDTTGCILVIEDVGEYLYNIDRMMWQLKRAGKLDRLNGLLVGSFTESQDNEIPFGMNEYEIVKEKVKDLPFPVCFGFPVGHQKENWALKMGSFCQLEVSDEGVVLKEMDLA
ncbi:MAG: S66 peptidase family protein [Chitinophagaceae bacterium]|jgi:muramoyltetrapeptide carboxypeptidase